MFIANLVIPSQAVSDKLVIYKHVSHKQNIQVRFQLYVKWIPMIIIVSIDIAGFCKTFLPTELNKIHENIWNKMYRVQSLYSDRLALFAIYLLVTTTYWQRNIIFAFIIMVSSSNTWIQISYDKANSTAC